MTVPTEFAARLSAAIDQSGITQNDLAYTLKTAPARISEWRNGRSEPRLPFLKGLCEALGISGHWLLTGRGSMTTTLQDQRIGELETLLEIMRLCQTGIENTARERATPEPAEIEKTMVS